MIKWIRTSRLSIKNSFCLGTAELDASTSVTARPTTSDIASEESAPARDLAPTAITESVSHTYLHFGFRVQGVGLRV